MQNQSIDDEIETTGYGLGGFEIDPNCDDALAKVVTDKKTGRSSYWLKRATSGPDSGNLFNPQSPTFNAQAAKRFHSAMNRGQYVYRKASKDSFELYLKFLQTGNPLNLRNAERY